VASRVEAHGGKRTPGIWSGLRAALTDFYFNSGRLVGANVVWGVAAVGLALVWLAWPLGTLILAPLLAFPTVGIFRVAARIVRRDGPVSFGDAFTAYRDYAGPTFILGLASVAAGLVLGTNAVVGLTQVEPVGWVIGTLATWGLVVAWCGLIVVWPIVVDPDRADESLRRRLRLVGLLLLAQPGRFALLGIVVALIAVVCTILVVALLTVGVSYIALVACRVVYPTADAFESARAVRSA
jgi:uncharacterized membrane protein YesL